MIKFRDKLGYLEISGNISRFILCDIMRYYAILCDSYGVSHNFT